MVIAYIGIILGSIIGAYILYLFVIALIPGISVPEQHLEKTKQPLQETETRPPGQRKEVNFEVKGTPLSAWLYLPEELSHPVPCVIMAHGLGGTKDAGLDAYAARFQEAGLAVLAFDFRHLGQSGGEPRQLVWIPRQKEDYSAAVEYVHTLDEIDPSKIALWGTSLSGGHVIVTAAKNNKIACVSAQVPLLDGNAGGIAVVKRIGLGHILKMAFVHGVRDMVRSFLGLSPHKVPIFGKTGSTAVLADDDAWEAFSQLAPDSFINEVCARIIIRMDKYHPIRQVDKVRCPVLFQACDKDIGIPIRVIEKAGRRLGKLAEVIRYPIDHFDIYLGDNFEKAVSDQLAFLKKHLL